MTYDELLDGLRASQALIVHFSHHAKMGRDYAFPDDLLNAAAIVGEKTLSCSVVWPDHCHSVGSVGIVLKPRTLQSIVSVFPSDSASLYNLDGTRESLGLSLTHQTFEQTFTAAVSGEYNEWEVTDAEVAGVFVNTTPPMLVKRRIPAQNFDGYELPEDMIAQPVSWPEILNVFPELPVYQFQNGMIVGIRLKSPSA